MSTQQTPLHRVVFRLFITLLCLTQSTLAFAYSPDSLFRGESAITSDSNASFTLTFGESLATNLTFKKDQEDDMVEALGRITFADEVYAQKAFIVANQSTDTQIEIGEAFGITSIQAKDLAGETKNLILNPHGSGVVVGDPTMFENSIGQEATLNVAGAIRLGSFEPTNCSDGSLRWGDCAVEVCYLNSWHKIMTEDNTCSGIQDPTEISGLVTWYDANDIDGDGAAENAYEFGISGRQVETWVDKAPNGYNATQSTNNFKPEVDFTGLNGMPVIEFDGDNDYLQESSYTGLEDENEYSIFFVANFNDVDQTLMSMTNNADQNGILLSSAGSEQLLTLHRYPFGTTGGDTVVASGLDSGYPHIATVIRSSDQYTAYIDDGAQYTAATSQAGINQTMMLTLGKQNSADTQFVLDGYIAEILVYNRELNSVEQEIINDYLYKKWFGSELPVSTDLVLHLDATRIEASNGQLISEWSDLSDNDNHAISSGGLRPKYRSAGINGFPALDFRNDRMDIVDDASLDSTNEMTTFIVARPMNVSGGSRGILSKRTENDTENAYSIYTTSTQKIGYDVDGDHNSIFSISNISANENYLITTVFDGNATVSQRGKMYFDDVLDLATEFTVSGIPDTDAGLYIGKLDPTVSNGFRGRIGEILMYDRSLSDQEIEEIQEYLINKWDL